MIMNRDRQNTLCMLLPDHVIIEYGADILRRRNAVLGAHQMRLVLLTDDIHAQFDAFIADEYSGTSDQLTHLMLALSAERAVKGRLGIAADGLGHRNSAKRGGREQ